LRPKIAVSIRLARQSDAGNLAALSTYVWLHSYANDGVRASYSKYIFEAFAPEKFEAAISDPGQQIWIWEEKKSLVAYLKLSTDSPCSDFPGCNAEISTLYVHPHFAGQGIGSALLKSSRDYCRECGFAHVWLSVHRENRQACNFYRKHHFSKIGSIMFELDDGSHENFVFLNSIS
jgi:ribosomal protein S18 acetylase RimI-like enzyme